MGEEEEEEEGRVVRGARSEEVRGGIGLGGVGRDRRGRAKACSRV